ncbi:MAG: hypothetical protein GY757_00575, partial [bacterium]|nr:hypothetical protein [bacterium]
CDAHLLELLLLYLEKLGLVKQEETRWKKTEQCRRDYAKYSQLKPVAAWEEHLAKGWVTAQSIIDALRAGIGGRPFDTTGLNKDELPLYIEAMYGENIKIPLLFLKRFLGKTTHLKLLEVGRSPAVITAGLPGYFSSFEAVAAIYPPFKQAALDKKAGMPGPARVRVIAMDEEWQEEDLQEEGLQKKGRQEKGFHVAVVNNTVHYWTPGEAEKWLAKIHNSLDSNGILMIHDFFIDEEDVFTVGLLPDWITHGGCYYVFYKEMITQLTRAGFVLRKSLRPPGLNSRIILLEKE